MLLTFGHLDHFGIYTDSRVRDIISRNEFHVCGNLFVCKYNFISCNAANTRMKWSELIMFMRIWCDAWWIGRKQKGMAYTIKTLGAHTRKTHGKNNAKLNQSNNVFLYHIHTGFITIHHSYSQAILFHSRALFPLSPSLSPNVCVCVKYAYIHLYSFF